MTITPEEELELFYKALEKFQDELKAFNGIRDLRSYFTEPENERHTRIVEKMREVRSDITKTENVLKFKQK